MRRRRVRDALSRLYANVGGGALGMDDLLQGNARRFATFNDGPLETCGGLFPVEEQFFARHIPPGSRVLVIGAGTGREIFKLQERGCVVAGLDSSGPALAVCRRRLDALGRHAELIEGTVLGSRLDGPFDVALFSYYCYGYIPTTRRRVEVLRKVASIIADGGRLLISYQLEGRPSALLTALARCSGALAGTDWRAARGDLLQREPGGRPGIRYSYEHIFTPQELAAELGAAGLVAIDHAGVPDYPWVVAAAP